MKRLMSMLLALILCIFLFACGGNSSQDTSATPIPTPEPTLSPKELAEKYNLDMSAALGSDERTPLTAGKAVTYWVDAEGVGTYNTKYLTDDWAAQTPDEAKYIVTRTEGTTKVGIYMGSIAGDALQRYVKIEISNSITGEVLADERFYGAKPPETITKNEDRFGSYPAEDEISQWILSSLTALSDAAKESARNAALAHLDFTEYSKAYLYNILLTQDGFTPDEASYAVENCGADWKAQALSFTKDLLSTMDYFRSELFAQLTTGWLFTEEEANYALDSCSVDWDQLNDPAITQALATTERWNQYSRAALIDYLTTYKNFSAAEAESAIDACGIDWNAQALKAADHLLNSAYGFGYSPNSLVLWMTEDLDMGGQAFTKEQAQYAADHCNADWMEQAEKAAGNWVEYWDAASYGELNKENLIWALTEIDQFTAEQAAHAAGLTGIG